MTSQNARLDAGGRIDRTISWRFTVDGEEFTGHPGDTLASALLANGRIAAGNSLYEDRARGIMSAGVEESNALVRIEPRFPGHVAESMLPATTVTLVDGLKAELLNGLGKLDPEEDRAEYDKKYVHTDVLVIGGGPAGLAAAREAARTGARVILMDDQPELGGSLLSGSTAPGLVETIEGKPALEWVADVEAELVSAAECTVLNRTTAFGAYDSNYVIAVQNRTDHLSSPAAPGVSRQRIWHVRANQVVVAPGAHERPLVFENNDRPGIMLASAVRTYLNRYAVAAGQRVLISTTNDSAYALAADLQAAGVKVAAVVDARAKFTDVAAAAVEAGTRVLIGSAVANTTGADSGDRRLNAVTVRSINDDGDLTSGIEEVPCDLLAVSGGWSPLVHLHSQRQGKLRWDDELAAFVPSTVVPNQQTIGSGRGSFELEDCLAEGISAGASAAIAAGFSPENAGAAADPLVFSEPKASAPTRQLWLVPGQSGTPDDWHHHFVDFQRDQSVADVLRSTGAGMRSVEHIKRYTSISTANDQGKTSGVNAIGVIAAALRQAGEASRGIGDIGTTTYRAPFTPVAFAALAGRQRGELFDPARVTSIHPWHVAQGALFEDVGQWKRPWYYPQDGEDMDAAVLRECAAVRESVGFMDATTLGKIEIRGKDAGEFLNRIYTNAFKKLAPGSARYGVMCMADGMIFDDGVTLRLDEDRFFMTTTTGGAAKVLDWLEEWLQTEWPELDVHCTSVTEQWTTIAVVGPKSRAVLAKLAPQLAADGGLEAEAFPFMTFQRNHPRLRRAGPGLPDLVLRRTCLRDQRSVLVRAEHLGSGGSGRGGIQHHPVRHRNHARAAGRKGLPDRRPGHRRDRHPAGRRDGMGCLQGQGLHRQTVLRPQGRRPHRPETPGQRSSRGRNDPPARRHPAGGKGDCHKPRRRPGPHAGIRDLELPQCRPWTFLWAGTDQERPQPHRRNPRGRRRRPARGCCRRRNRTL